MRYSAIAFLLLLASMPAQRAEAINYSAEVLSLNPVAYWRLGENSAAPNAVDEVGGSPGTFNNVVAGDFSQPGALAGDSNTAMRFNGSNSFINGANIPIGTFSGEWTITGWFNRTGQTTWGSIFSNSVGTNQTPLLGFMDNNNQLGMNNAGSSAENVHVDFGGDNHFGEWIFGAISHTGPDAGGMLHVTAILDDGTLLQNSGTYSWTINATEDEYYIARHFSGGHYFNGLIDEVAIFNTALSTGDLQGLYTAATTVPEPSSFALAGLGLLGLAGWGLRRRKA